MQKVMEHKLLVVNIIAAIILICVFFYFMSGKETVEKTPVVSTDCKDIQNAYTKDACYFELAIKNTDANSCASITDADQKDLCYMEIAIAKADRTVCNSIADKFYTKPRCAAEISNLKTGQI